jgi:hypothetical protein
MMPFGEPLRVLVELFAGLSTTDEAVEKIGVVPINNLESGSKWPKIGVSGVRSGIRNRHEGVFQQAQTFSETRLPLLRSSRKLRRRRGHRERAIKWNP